MLGGREIDPFDFRRWCKLGELCEFGVPIFVTLEPVKPGRGALDFFFFFELACSSECALQRWFSTQFYTVLSFNTTLVTYEAEENSSDELIGSRSFTAVVLTRNGQFRSICFTYEKSQAKDLVARYTPIHPV